MSNPDYEVLLRQIREHLEEAKSLYWQGDSPLPRILDALDLIEQVIPDEDKP